MPSFNMTQRACIGFNASFIIFIVFVIGIRLYSRYGITKSGGPDDSMYRVRAFIAKFDS